MNRFVYFDNNSTTKLSIDVLAYLQPYLTLQYGNPSNLYTFGKKIKNEINKARNLIADYLKIETNEIIFTSGGSESNCSAFNHSIKAYPNKKKIITTAVEHASILEYCKILAKIGYEIIYLSVDMNGYLNLNQLENSIDENTSIVSIQYVNNETGIITNMDKISEIINRKKQVFDFIFHSDAVQALGKIHLNLSNGCLDMVSFSGHKIHALKGAGILYINKQIDFIPMITGHQENDKRGGTENVLGIISIGKAIELINNNFSQNTDKIIVLHDYLEKKLNEFTNIKIVGKNANRINNTTNMIIKGYNGNELMLKLEQQGIHVSTGSACNSIISEPSHVLVAMKIEDPQSAIRISLSEENIKDEVDYFIDKLNLIINGK